MGNPRNTVVDVTFRGIDPDTGQADFDIQPTGSDPLPTLPPPNSKHPHRVLVFDNQKHDGVCVEFRLKDATGEGYSFPPSKIKDMAVSSQLGACDLCPDTDNVSHDPHEVFQVVSVTGPKNCTLTVFNPNVPPYLGDFSYVLWITKDGGKHYVPLDPGGTNKNGSTGFSLVSPFAAVVGVAVVAAAALFALYKLNVFER